MGGWDLFLNVPRPPVWEPQHESGVGRGDLEKQSFAMGHLVIIWPPDPTQINAHGSHLTAGGGARCLTGTEFQFRKVKKFLDGQG